jgi:hypothetical protein
VVVALTLPLALPAEPRFIAVGWPFLVLGAALAIDRTAPRRPFGWTFGLLTVLLAQFWMKLNVGRWGSDDYADLLEFPKQLYFMHYGPWMAWYPFLIQSAVLGAGAFALHWTLRRHDERMKAAAMIGAA